MSNVQWETSGYRKFESYACCCVNYADASTQTRDRAGTEYGTESKHRRKKLTIRAHACACVHPPWRNKPQFQCSDVPSAVLFWVVVHIWPTRRGHIWRFFLDDCHFNGLTSSLVTKSTSSVHNIVRHILVSTRFQIFALTAREISYVGREIIGKGELSGNMFEWGGVDRKCSHCSFFSPSLWFLESRHFP